MQVLALVTSVLLMGYIVWLSSTERAAREARVDADNRAAVQDCFSRNAQGPASERFFHVLTIILKNQGHLAQSALTATNQAPETAKQFHHVIERADAAIADVASFRSLSESTTPTRKECRKLAQKLDVRLPT